MYFANKIQWWFKDVVFLKETQPTPCVHQVLRVLRLVRILRPIRLLKRVRALRESGCVSKVMAGMCGEGRDCKDVILTIYTSRLMSWFVAKKWDGGFSWCFHSSLVLVCKRKSPSKSGSNMDIAHWLPFHWPKSSLDLADLGKGKSLLRIKKTVDQHNSFEFRWAGTNMLPLGSCFFLGEVFNTNSVGIPIKTKPDLFDLLVSSCFWLVK